MTVPSGVHPVADLFPMLADDELAELAEDIRQRGLLHPIVLDAEGRVLDGRNRLAACALAGVEPTFGTFDGDDPGGYAVAVNIARRHLTKGQQAMLIVESGQYPEYTDAAEIAKISKQYISHARVVKKYAPALVSAVISGADQLNRAYDFAQQEKTKSEGVEAQLAKLRAEDPELAAKVIEGELSLTGAWAERKERVAVQRAHAVRVSDSFRTIIGRVLVLYKTPELRAEVAAIYADDLGNAMPAEVNADTIREAGDYLHLIADEWKDQRS